MANVLHKMRGFLGLDDEYDDEYDDDEMELEEEEIEPVVSSNRRVSKVVNINAAPSVKNSATKMSIIKPTDFEQATDIVDDLQGRKIVVFNTTLLEPKTAQRLLDFISGASYSLGGELQEVERGVYVLSPSNVEVSNDLKTEISSKGLFNWK
ncbi:cell division protein SepF [Clostridium frigidicarnis]|uniref:Cell division protein SepF n=1 Tax=Clostridium frigidicarnis TaxID=84698 RepID=A0A1I0WI56_9CLOT|nr:cell division protein SepF [Clostridium frigidicarnis]SFA88244.1 cell division inhibitor SepF [Clostridium frigidicarnis]